jgi:hypothetical protein
LQLAFNCGTTQPAAQATKEGQKAPDALVLTPYEKVTATATGGFWLGLIGLGAVGVYFVARELLPKYVGIGAVQGFVWNWSDVWCDAAA